MVWWSMRKLHRKIVEQQTQETWNPMKPGHLLSLLLAGSSLSLLLPAASQSYLHQL